MESKSNKTLDDQKFQQDFLQDFDKNRRLFVRNMREKYYLQQKLNFLEKDYKRNITEIDQVILANKRTLQRTMSEGQQWNPRVPRLSAVSKKSLQRTDSTDKISRMTSLPVIHLSCDEENSKTEYKSIANKFNKQRALSLAPERTIDRLEVANSKYQRSKSIPSIVIEATNSRKEVVYHATSNFSKTIGNDPMLPEIAKGQSYTSEKRPELDSGTYGCHPRNYEEFKSKQGLDIQKQPPSGSARSRSACDRGVSLEPLFEVHPGCEEETTAGSLGASLVEDETVTNCQRIVSRCPILKVMERPATPYAPCTISPSPPTLLFNATDSAHVRNISPTVQETLQETHSRNPLGIIDKIEKKRPPLPADDRVLDSTIPRGTTERDDCQNKRIESKSFLEVPVDPFLGETEERKYSKGKTNLGVQSGSPQFVENSCVGTNASQREVKAITFSSNNSALESLNPNECLKQENSYNNVSFNDVQSKEDSRDNGDSKGPSGPAPYNERLARSFSIAVSRPMRKDHTIRFAYDCAARRKTFCGGALEPGLAYANLSQLTDRRKTQCSVIYERNTVNNSATFERNLAKRNSRFEKLMSASCNCNDSEKLMDKGLWLQRGHRKKELSKSCSDPVTFETKTLSEQFKEIEKCHYLRKHSYSLNNELR